MKFKALLVFPHKLQSYKNLQQTLTAENGGRNCSPELWFSSGKYHVHLPDHKRHSSPTFRTRLKCSNTVSLCSLIFVFGFSFTVYVFPFLLWPFFFFLSFFPFNSQKATTVQTIPQRVSSKQLALSP